MRFSIIVPTYMEKDYIERCLRSMLAQDYPREEFETIVADADSRDGTQEAARKYADKTVSTRRRGISVGRNLGAAQARGGILVFVDADVTLHKDFLRHMERAFQSEVVGVVASWIPIDGGYLKKAVYYMNRLLVYFFNALGLPLYPAMAVAYRREEFLREGGFREDFGIVEDLDMSRRISRLGRCTIEKKAIVFLSTRRLEKNMLSMITFHVYNDILYLLTGRASSIYPKAEELKSGGDIWRVNRRDKHF